MTEMLFGIKEKDKISNYEIRLKAYKNKYKIFCKDYLSDYDFLNAMKHGCRISFNTGGTVRVGDQKIFSADTTLIYFTKKNKCVYKHSILFDHKHMIVDLLYVLSMLENTVSVVNNRLLGGGRLKVTHIFPLEPYADRKARLSKPIDIGLFSESG